METTKRKYWDKFSCVRGNPTEIQDEKCYLVLRMLDKTEDIKRDAQELVAEFRIKGLGSIPLLNTNP